MRLIGTLPDERLARQFADYLLAQGINIVVEESSSDSSRWQVWVESDDHVEQARAELAQFAVNSDDPKYRHNQSKAARIRAQEESRSQRRQRQYIDVRTSWARPAIGPRPLTFVLIALCCVVAAASLSVRGGRSPAQRLEGMQKFWAVISPLLISTHLEGLPEILHGQVWRLITPIFIHFSIWHLLFNMLWLYELGSVIEVRKGSLTLLALVVVSGITSNFLQYLWPIENFADLFRFWRLSPNPLGGGMSGVVYALFGYVWMKGRLQPHEHMGASPSTVLIMLVWLVVCFSGFMGAIGNTAHLTGLIVGVIFGATPYYWRRLGR